MKINKLISLLAINLLVGIGLITAVIISIIDLFQYFHSYLEQFENATTLQIASYSAVLALCFVGIYLLIMTNIKSTKPVSIEHSLISILPANFKSLKINFIEGIISGLMKEREIVPSTNQRSDT